MSKTGYFLLINLLCLSIMAFYSVSGILGNLINSTQRLQTSAHAIWSISRVWSRSEAR